MTAIARTAPLAIALLAACDDVDGGRHQEFLAEADVTVTARAQEEFPDYPAVLVAALVIESESERAVEMGLVPIAVIEEPGEEFTAEAGLYAALGPCMERDVQVVAYLAAQDDLPPGSDLAWGLPVTEPVSVDAIASDRTCGPYEAAGLKLVID